MGDNVDGHRFQQGGHAALGKESFAERAAAQERNEARHDAAGNHHAACTVDQGAVAGHTAQYRTEPRQCLPCGDVVAFQRGLHHVGGVTQWWHFQAGFSACTAQHGINFRQAFAA